MNASGCSFFKNVENHPFSGGASQIKSEVSENLVLDRFDGFRYFTMIGSDKDDSP